MSEFSITHPFLVCVWIVPAKLGQPFFEYPYWMEMARCLTNFRATEVAHCLAMRHRLVQVCQRQGDRYIPILSLPDEETVRREAHHD